MHQLNFTVDNTIDFSSLDISPKSNVINVYLNTLFHGHIGNSIVTLDTFQQEDNLSLTLLYDYMMIADSFISNIEQKPGSFLLVDNLSLSDFFTTKKTSIILSYANPALVSSRPEIIRQMYRLGFRSLTINKPLNEFGLNPGVINSDIINEANRLGMIINCNGFDKKNFEMLPNSKVIISNVGSYSICPHPNNITDSDLLEIKKRGNLLSLSLNDFCISRSYFTEVNKFREMAEWEIKYLEVEYSFDSLQLESRKLKIQQDLQEKISKYKSSDISWKDLIIHISYIKSLIGIGNIHLASGIGEILNDQTSRYYQAQDIVDVLIKELLSAGYDNKSIDDMIHHNIVNFIQREKQ